MVEKGGNRANNRFGFRRFLICRSRVRIPQGVPEFNRRDCGGFVFVDNGGKCGIVRQKGYKYGV